MHALDSRKSLYCEHIIYLLNLIYKTRNDKTEDGETTCRLRKLRNSMKSLIDTFRFRERPSCGSTQQPVETLHSNRTRRHFRTRTQTQKLNRNRYSIHFQTLPRLRHRHHLRWAAAQPQGYCLSRK